MPLSRAVASGGKHGSTLRYLAQNGLAGLQLVHTWVEYGVSCFVLSSTANLYESPAPIPASEVAPIAPGSPYSESKWMIERALLWAGRLHGIRSVSVRYLNAAGADIEGRPGEDHTPETQLIPSAMDAGLRRRGPLEILGSDYDTPDGTCIRDYVHVVDLAAAHLRALQVGGGGFAVFNVGGGRGYSVREVIAVVEAASGRSVLVVWATRRQGDPAALVACCRRFHEAAQWKPRHSSLRLIVSTALAWRERHPQGCRTAHS